MTMSTLIEVFLTRLFSSPQQSDLLNGDAAGESYVTPTAILDRQITRQPMDPYNAFIDVRISA